MLVGHTSHTILSDEEIFLLVLVFGDNSYNSSGQGGFSFRAYISIGLGLQRYYCAISFHL